MNNYVNKSVLVTGATGFIGSNLVNRLVKYGAKVKVLVRDSKNTGKLNKKGVEIFEGDLTNIKSLDNAIRNTHIIFNVAAGLPHHHLKSEEYRRINVQGLENIIKIAIEKKVGRIVHVSTVGIYGTTANNVDEKSHPMPSDYYSKSKLEGEKIIRKYKSKIPVVIVRPTIAYGPGDTRPGFLNLFRMIKKGLFIPIGNGKNYFHTIYIDNLIDGLVLAGVKKNALGEDFIIADDPCSTLGEIVSIMYELLGKKKPTIYIPKALVPFGIPVILNTRRINFLTEQKCYRIHKSKKILGYNPKINIKEGLKSTLNWYKKNKMI